MSEWDHVWGESRRCAAHLGFGDIRRGKPPPCRHASVRPEPRIRTYPKSAFQQRLDRAEDKMKCKMKESAHRCESQSARLNSLTAELCCSFRLPLMLRSLITHSSVGAHTRRFEISYRGDATYGTCVAVFPCSIPARFLLPVVAFCSPAAGDCASFIVEGVDVAARVAGEAAAGGDHGSSRFAAASLSNRSCSVAGHGASRLPEDDDAGIGGDDEGSEFGGGAVATSPAGDGAWGRLTTAASTAAVDGVLAVVTSSGHASCGRPGRELSGPGGGPSATVSFGVGIADEDGGDRMAVLGCGTYLHCRSRLYQWLGIQGDDGSGWQAAEGSSDEREGGGINTYDGISRAPARWKCGERNR